jgi:hypothetical protein
MQSAIPGVSIYHFTTFHYFWGCLLTHGSLVAASAGMLDKIIDEAKNQKKVVTGAGHF